MPVFRVSVHTPQQRVFFDIVAPKVDDAETAIVNELWLGGTPAFAIDKPYGDFLADQLGFYVSDHHAWWTGNEWLSMDDTVDYADTKPTNVVSWLHWKDLEKAAPRANVPSV